nr:hypothetical protein [Tanacetum cinerariifolium]
MRPFGCPVTILNTFDPLDKFQRKVDEGFLVGYSICSKAFRVFNSRTRIIQETLHVNFLENKPNVAGTGPTWLFDINSLTRTMNYQPVNARNKTNSGAGFQDKFDAEKAWEEIDQSYMLFLVWSAGLTNPQNNAEDVAFDGKEYDFDVKKPESEVILSPSSSAQSKEQEFKDCSKNNSNEVNAAGSIVLTVGHNSLNSTNTFSAAEMEDITYSNDEDVVGAEADFNNLESFIPSAFLYETIEEEVYVCQPPGFEDPDHPDKVYKVVKALYALYPAPRAWYETLATYLLENDDIIFGATNKDLCRSFEKLMKDKFQMSSMGELTFFLGLQVKQKKDGIFISQDKYVAEILRKFWLTEGKLASTPIDTEKPLLKDPDGDEATATIKKVNDDVQLRALIDGKKVVVSKAIIRRDFHLDDADGVECLPNAEIFEELA